ncbi:PLP-dependent transferase [Marivibrio halodurans]|uniref:PLP-dependent transferase n=1 Tax=Marivibrio halodurans TaxID=2039722 RepID=A0A8J7S5M3_9PROT|nr:PLP-dependent aspartate aminotransferase family protein [Marivibrio halodurans]MBP5858943.1 PLP-dependent transferase [Marivibrio halodurans]
MTQPPTDPRTLLAQALHYTDPATGAVTPPIHMASTYARDGNYDLIAGASYSRPENPTYLSVERVIAALDGAAESLTFASGMAGVAAVLETVPRGKRIAAPTMLYHGSRVALKRFAETRGLGLDFYDARAADGLSAVLAKGETDLVWIETTLNPTWEVLDIAATARAAHAAGAALAVDATCTPALTIRPLALGADIVFQSATKYLGGHSDLVAGALSTADPDGPRWQAVRQVRTLNGGVLGPMEAWLLLRGMRTLALRWERACDNAHAIAQHFDGHPALEGVLYPGLESHPDHAIARRQFTGGFGGMLSLLVKGGGGGGDGGGKDETGFAAAKRVATATRLIIPATSLGGVETLIEHRKAIEPPDSPVPDNLLRLSIGIEAVADLIADLERSLDAR